MAGRLKLALAENSEELKELLRQQKTVRADERVQFLYLLKLNSSNSSTSCSNVRVKSVIRENIILMFQPPHCPELHPIEQV
jgi:hypothetical protein